MAKTKSSGGGIKGFLSRAGSSFYAGGLYVKEKGLWLAKMSGKVGFIIATTSIVTLMPLIFEITREGQVRPMSLIFMGLLCDLYAFDAICSLTVRSTM